MRYFVVFNPLKNQNQRYEVRMDFKSTVFMPWINGMNALWAFTGHEPGYECRMAFPAPYQGDFKRLCVSPTYNYGTHAKLSWNTYLRTIKPLTTIGSVRLECTSHLGEYAAKPPLPMECVSPIIKKQIIPKTLPSIIDFRALLICRSSQNCPPILAFDILPLRICNLLPHNICHMSQATVVDWEDMHEKRRRSMD